MRDPGLTEAINAVGSISELARKLRISQPSVSNWTRIPADRVLAIEEITGVDRQRLRPDLYAASAQAEGVDEVDAARAQEYALLAVLLLRAPDADTLARVAALRGDPSPLGLAHIALAEAAAATDVRKVEREFFDLFIGIGRGELLPYGSYYLTGFLHERPLARLRQDLALLGIERSDGNYEPEDQAATLLEIMSALTGGRFAAPAGSDRDIFDKHLAPWIGRFFADLERAETADFYRRVGALGRVFMDIECEAYAMPS